MSQQFRFYTLSSQDPPPNAHKTANQDKSEPSFYKTIHRASQQKNQVPLRQVNPTEQFDKKVDNRSNFVVSLDNFSQ